MNTKVWTLLVLISLFGCSNSEPETPEKTTPDPIVTPEPITEPNPEPTPEPEPETYEVTLSWTTPSEMENGESLQPFEIDGYYIRWGQESDNLINEIRISNGINTHTIDGLETGEYFFAISVEDQFGNQSELSNQISKTFP